MPSDSVRPALLIDDDTDVLEVLTFYLGRAGIPAKTASDGNAALALLRDGLQPGVIVMDIMMPGMDGMAFRAAQRGEPAWATIPVIVLSGAYQAEATAKRMEAAAFLAKPVEPVVLAELIKQVSATLLPGEQ